MEECIRIENVNKYYGKKHALKDIDLTIEKGMFGLLGRNGAGKTTLMKLLSTLHGKQSGKVTVCGIPIEKSAEIRKITGYLPQDFSMYPSMKVSECLDYLGTLSGMKKQERKERIELLLRKVNLYGQRNNKVKSLSGGMKRRLGIAQALLHNPKVLIVDEPTAGLDPEERIRFRNLLCEVAEERIVILSTHIVGDIEATCENIAIMNEGSILWNGSIGKILDLAKGKVFTATVSKNNIAKVKAKYMITAMLKQGEDTQVRFISEERPDNHMLKNMEAVSPNCEDAYMYCLISNGCDISGGIE